MNINAVWKNRGEDKSPCSRILVWKENGDDVAGVVGGYSGGGCFQIELFIAKFYNGKLVFLWIDGLDYLTNKEKDISDINKSLTNTAEEALDYVWLWNDQTEWEASENLYLLPNKKNDLIVSEDILTVSTAAPSWMRQVCENVGLISLPR